MSHIMGITFRSMNISQLVTGKTEALPSCRSV